MSPIARRACETARVSDAGVTRVSGQSCVEQLAGRHHAPALAHQEREQRQRLRLDLDRPPAVAQLAAGLVELVVAEAVPHLRARLDECGCRSHLRAM